MALVTWIVRKMCILPASITEVARPHFVVKGKVAWCQLPEIISTRSTHCVFAEEFFNRCLRLWCCCFPFRSTGACGCPCTGSALLKQDKSTALEECQLDRFGKPALFFINKFNTINNDKDFMANSFTEFRSFIKSVNVAVNLDACETCAL